MSNPGGSIRPGGVKTGPSSVKPPVPDGGPIIEESQESEEYQQDLQVVVGTTIGVIALVGLVVVAVLLYRVYRARQRALAYSHHNDDSLDRNISMDIGGEKCQPVVFLLYANDCPLHQRVVEALAGFLMEVCGVTITLDILEEADIMDRGIDDWLVDRLQEADYIMVMCSLGARLRCSKKHVRFKPVGQHLLPDYFSVAVDYVAEKMRVEKQKGLCTDKFMAVYMDYSTASDVPPQLETAARFCLMKDIHKLHTYLKTCGPESIKSDNGSQNSNTISNGGGGGGSSGDCQFHYHETETGALLKATIEQTKAYFKENPSWMDDRLEQSTSSVPHWVGLGKSSSAARKRQQHHESIEESLLLLTNSVPPPKSVHGYEPNQSQKHQNHRWSSKLSPDIDLNLLDPNRPISSSMVDINDPHYHKHRRHRTHTHPSNRHQGEKGSKSGLGFQARQNSLPSSLASSGFVPSPANKSKKDRLVFRSMDNFCVDSHGDGTRMPTDHDGVPCLFCGYCHMDGVPECKLWLNAPSSLKRRCHDEDINYESVHNLNTSAVSINNTDNGINNYSNAFSHSQTILQAEVHQEWGTPVRKHCHKDNMNNKSNTFGGHLRHWDSDQDVTQPIYQSLPAHHPPPTSSMLSEWDGLGNFYNNGRKTNHWIGNEEAYIPESPSQRQQRNEVLNGVGGNFYHQRSRTLSQSSIYTNGSESLSSDADSLKRDLQSIQNISSFQDFVNSSLFITESPLTSDRVPNTSHLIPSLTSPSFLGSFQKFNPPLSCPSSHVENGTGGVEGIEMGQVRTDPLDV